MLGTIRTSARWEKHEHFLGISSVILSEFLFFSNSLKCLIPFDSETVSGTNIYVAILFELPKESVVILSWKHISTNFH